MNHSIVLSIFNFLIPFGFLAAIVFGLRALFRRGKKSALNLPQSFAPDGMENDAIEWPTKRGRDHLAPPAVPGDDFDYHQAADYVLDRNSPYSIPLPPRRDDGE